MAWKGTHIATGFPVSLAYHFVLVLTPSPLLLTEYCVELRTPVGGQDSVQAHCRLRLRSSRRVVYVTMSTLGLDRVSVSSHVRPDS